MNIILFTRHGARCRGLRVGTASWIIAGVLFGGVIPGAAYYAGQQSQTDRSSATPSVAGRKVSARHPLPRPDAGVDEPVQSRLFEEVEQRVEQGVDQQIGAMAPRLARLQAQAARLDAVANRLLQVSGADPAEFRGGSGGPEPADARRYTGVEFGRALDRLSARLELQQRVFDGLDQWLIERRLEEATTPSGWPIAKGWVSSHFGRRSDPITGKRSTHHGVDIAAKRGTAIKAVAAGIVSFSGTRNGYGRIVELNHGNGYRTVYAHNQRNKVRVGERVDKGQTVATVGSSGRATGPHLHFEVRHHGQPINPETYLRASR